MAAVPTAQQLAEAAAHTDFSLLEIDEEKRTLRISDPAASLDVGALGKGYATERAAEYLESIGVGEYDPLAIIRKTEGRMAEDDQWMKIEVIV